MTEDIIYHSTGSKCALSFCKNICIETGGEGQLSFFSFPKDPVRCAIWVENCDSKYLPKVAVHNLSRRYKLCSLHFEDRMFDFQKKGLLSNAVPTLFKNKVPVIKPVTSKNVYKTITVYNNKIPPAIPIDAMPPCSKYDKVPVITSVTSKNVYKTITINDDKIPPAIPIDATTQFCSNYDKVPVITPVTSKNVYKTITINDDKTPPAIPIDATTQSCSKYDKVPVITPVTSKNVYKTITINDDKIPPAIPIDATTQFCSKYDKVPVITPVTSKNVNETITVEDNKIPPAISIDTTPSCSKYDMYISQPLFDKSIGIGLHSVNLQTPAYLSASSPRKRKLRKKLSEEVNLKKRLEKTVIELRKQLEETKTENNCLKLCEMYLPPTMYMLVKNYLMNKYKSPNGQRYLKEITQFAYTIHHLGPKAYNFLQNHFNLPHMHTLRKKSIQNIDKNVQDTIENDHKYSKI
ncbi:uncharacterized protein LOC132922394 isoform X3 [Rhopalosiphum padi]|uniref:uncharacterized protein LOC132922394 isoform X3 n=1 Tax=Rhopalosiphum padi TaxID=40932 RepID=UPI00298DD1BB|nr:uncharacterized protein LOC132922394 isoform X3 [Rhopalosiphum padi]